MALECVIEETQELIFSIIYTYVKDTSVLDDLAQETYLKAFSAIDSIRNREAIKSWLCSIARNLAINWVQRTKKTRGQDILDLVSSKDIPPEKYLQNKEKREFLTKILSELKGNEREMLVMKYIGDMSYKEIASALGMSVSGVGEKLSRIVHELRNKLGNISGDQI